MIAPVAERFTHVAPENFGPTLRQYLSTVERLSGAVIDCVEEETITPLQGLAITAAIVGQVFGYNEFHKEARPADLLAALYARGWASDGR